MPLTTGEALQAVRALRVGSPLMRGSRPMRIVAIHGAGGIGDADVNTGLKLECVHESGNGPTEMISAAQLIGDLQRE